MKVRTCMCADVPICGKYWHANDPLGLFEKCWTISPRSQVYFDSRL